LQGFSPKNRARIRPSQSAHKTLVVRSPPEVGETNAPNESPAGAVLRDPPSLSAWGHARYFDPELHWGSDDGVSWDNDAAGDPAGGAEFAAARIQLVGGPRDGVIVA
jgi:hypothetical protein